MSKLREAFSAEKLKKGEVKFRTSSFDDAHIKKIIKHIATETGESEGKIKNDIDAKVKQFDEIAKKAPILYETIHQNVIEHELFFYLNKVKVKTAPEFSIVTFNKLIDTIKLEHDQFFPLRNFIDHKALHNPKIILIPSPHYPEFDEVKTACATADGTFAFNKHYMQHLIDYAHLADIDPKGKKYSNHGGKIPKEYAYVEFTIMHEFMHYSYADFHYHKILKADPQIINWVGDFRTNYLLIKSGYLQRPVGLINDNVNYDRQSTYKEMYEVVKAEFEKLNKDEQDKVKNEIGDIEGGEHEPAEGEDGQDGEGDPTESGEKKDGKGKGQKSDKEKATDEKIKGASEGDIDEHNKSVEEKLSKRKDLNDDERDKKAAADSKKKGESAKGGTTANKRDSGESSFDYSKVKPTYSWQQLLNKCITDVSNKTEETYHKPSSRGITNAEIARQTGAAAVKPGEVVVDEEIKICFIVDSSGSMSSAIDKVYANIDALLKKNTATVGASFYLIKYSNDFHIYRCDARKKKFVKLTDVKDKSKATEQGDIKELFSKHIGGGTNFDAPLVSAAEKLSHQNYNLVVFTDTDILGGSNFDNFLDLYKKCKSRLFVLADTKDTYHHLIGQLKQVSKNITYIEE